MSQLTPIDTLVLRGTQLLAEARRRNAFAIAELRVWREICRRDWPVAELQVLSLILAVSFGMRRRRAYVPSLNYFAEYTGQAKPHVSTALSSLKRRRVVQETRKGVYRLLVLFGNWDVDLLPGTPAAVMMELELLPESKDLYDGATDALIDETILSGPGISATGASGQPLEQDPGRERSPDSGPADKCLREARTEPGANSSTSDWTMGAGELTPPSSAGISKVDQKKVTDFVTSVVTKSVTLPHEGSATAVTDFVTSPQKPNVDAVQPGVTDFVTVPPSGSPSGFPPLESPLVPVNRSTVNRLTGTGTARALVTRDEERRLFDLVKSFVTEKDPFLGWFRGNAIRSVPDCVDEALATARMLEHEGYAFANKGKWLTAKICRIAGVETMSQIRPGPPPAR